jgi:hypothetical protein
MKTLIKKTVVRTIAARAFAKKAPILGAILASEDVLKKLGAAGLDYMAGHKLGAKNELQQAITHAVGAAVNFAGSMSILGMTAGMVAQTMAQRHADSIAAKKPPPPDIKPTMYTTVVNTAKAAAITAKAVKTGVNATARITKPRVRKPKTATAKAQKGQ